LGIFAQQVLRWAFFSACAGGMNPAITGSADEAKPSRRVDPVRMPYTSDPLFAGGGIA
jgi:hypothetical protein